MLDAIIENKDAKGNKQEEKKNKSFSIIIPFFVSEMRITYIRFFITLIFKLLRSNGWDPNGHSKRNSLSSRYISV